jgi:TolB-like protein/DNA-binding winged helix-turn-helix (wHTH) protein/Flp pilus assembly protein TadD
MSVQTKVVFEFGSFRLNPAERLLLRDQAQVHLPPKAFDALVVLIENRGHLLEKDELLRKVWPDTFVEESNLAQHISVLRKALQDGEDRSRCIETVPRRGYRFIAEVRELGGITPEASVVSGPTPSQQPSLGVPESIPARHRFPILTYAIAVLVLLLAVLISTLPVWRRLRSAGPQPIRSLAVLPLQNLSAEPAQEYFADGMTEALITDLAKIPGLKVISRTSIMRYKDSHKKLPQIAQELGVDGIVEGAVLRSGDRVRITAQLVRAATDQHIWAESYERNMRDLLTLQDEVASNVAAQIRIEITPREANRPPNSAGVDPESQEDYLKGRYFWNQRTRAAYLKAIESFNGAIAETPNYAQAYAGLADTYALLGSLPEDAKLPRGVLMSEAKEAALAALHLDDSLAEAHTSLAFVEMHYEWNFKEADREFQRAIQLNPNYGTAHQWYAFDLTALGRMDEAVSEVKRARQVDPLSLIINTDVAEILYYAHRYDDALKQGRATVEMDPNFPFAHNMLARIYAQKQMYSEAIFEGERAVALTGEDPWMISELAVTYAMAGKAAEMKRCLRRLAKVSPSDSPRDPMAWGLIFATRRENDRAFRALDMAYNKREGGLILMNIMPALDGLRSDPRFSDLARRVGLPQ